MSKQKNTPSPALPPSSLWSTLINRAIFGLEADIENNPNFFLTDEYLNGVIAQEIVVNRNFSRAMFSLFVLNSISLMLVSGIKMDLMLFGVTLSKIPASTHTLCFFLGLNLFGFSLLSLDTIIISRIRNLLVRRRYGTDTPNLYISNLKGNGLSVDALIPKFIGYSSGPVQRLLAFVIITLLIMFYVCIFVASTTSLVSLYQFGLKEQQVYMSWATVVSTAGLVIGCLGSSIFAITLFLPFRYKIKT